MKKSSCIKKGRGQRGRGAEGQRGNPTDKSGDLKYGRNVSSTECLETIHSLFSINKYIRMYHVAKGISFSPLPLCPSAPLLLRSTLLLTALMLGQMIMPSPSLAAKTSKSSGGILAQIQDIFSNINSEVLQSAIEFGVGFGQYSSEVQQAIQKSIGVLGIPDPSKAGRNIEGVLSDKPVAAGDAPAQVQARVARREWGQQYSKAQSEAVSGQTGQEIMQQENEDMDNAVADAGQESTGADSDTISQDLLRRMVRNQERQIIGAQASQQELQAATKMGASTSELLSNEAERQDGRDSRQLMLDRIASNQALAASTFNDNLWAKPTNTTGAN